MKIHLIPVKVTYWGFAHVPADNLEEAMEKASKLERPPEQAGEIFMEVPDKSTCEAYNKPRG